MTDGDGFYIHIGDDYDVFVASWGDNLGDDWYHMHLEESKTLHAFEYLVSGLIIE